ncbi:MAG: PD40 domain-containing protein [Candidatus Solibacter usitatus]|nr:PD40 domain-containing protein [Candidatus Solibacter usitatus]
MARLENLQRVSIPNEVLLSPVLGPGSTNLYFASNRGGSSFRIWRQSQDGSGSQPLTPAESDAFDLDISSDGAWLAYWSSRNGGGLYQLSAAGGDELLITSQGRSPRFSPTGDRIVFWKENRVTGFGSAYWSGIKQGQHDREPQPVVNDFDDAHTPQWTRDGLVILCGTRKTNIPEMEHDLWIVDAGGAGSKSTRIKTGILPFLKKRGINPHQRALPFTPFRFWNDDLIFAGMKQGKTALYALRLSPQDWRPQSEPVLLHEGLESDDTPYVRDSKVAFVSTQSNLNIWGIPLSVEGTASGAAQRLTEDGGDEFFPAVSLDGRVLVFVAWRPPNYQLWRKNLGAGVEEELLRTDDMKYLSLNAQGSKAVFRSMAGSFPQQQQIHSLDLATRQSSLTCANCGSPTSISPDGQFILHETGSQVARLAVLHVSSGRRQEILRHPNHPVQGARFSPDGKWLVFELDKGADGTQILAAPFRGLTDIPPTSWTELTDQRSSNFGPAWGPDGTSVYFLSERAGTRDLSMQKLDGKTKRAVGEAHPIYRFSNPSLTPLTYHVRPRRYVGLSVGKGRAALTLSELSSKVGIGRLQ